jgi:hypothetical protein
VVPHAESASADIIITPMVKLLICIQRLLCAVGRITGKRKRSFPLRLRIEAFPYQSREIVIA